MILIGKEEVMAVRVNFPDAHITRTMKNKSSRHRYYCEENKRVLEFLANVCRADYTKEVT